MKKRMAVLCLLLPLLLGGCWNRREIGKLSIVMGFAVDKTDSPDKIRITSQIANTKNAARTEEGKEESADFQNVSVEGEYVFPSIRSSVSKSGAKLYMAHNFVVLFGEDIARRGVSPYMDFFVRDHELRMDMNLLTAHGEAADILDTAEGFQKIPSIHIKDLITAQEQLSTGATVTVFDFMNRLSAGRSAPIMPIIETDGEGKSRSLRMAGTAVFSGDKMIGELDSTETRGYLWPAGKVKNAVLIAEADGDRIGMDVLRADGSIRPEKDENGEIVMVLSVRAEGSLGSERGKRDFTTEDGREAALRAFSGEIEREIRACLRKSHTLRADIWGFSDILYRRMPDEWEKRKDAPLYALPVRIEVRTRLLASGRIRRPE